MITLFHDYTSPASAIAVARLQRLSDEGIPIEFVGFEVLALDAALPPSLDVLAALEKRGFGEIEQRAAGVTQFVGGRLKS